MAFITLRIQTEDEAKYFFEYLFQTGISRRLVSCSDLAKCGRLYGVEDSMLVSSAVRGCLFEARQKIQKKLPNDYGLFQIPLNSCYRRPFTVVEGKIDYLDLTTMASHFTGLSVDVDFKTFEEDTGLPRVELYRALVTGGLENSLLKNKSESYWLKQPYEYWHFSWRVRCSSL